MKGVCASLTWKIYLDRSSNVHLIPNFTERSLCYQKLCLGFLIRPLNPARNVYRVADSSDSLLQATSHSANDGLAKVQTDPNSEIAVEQSLDIRL
jgi:hypothetical protein